MRQISRRDFARSATTALSMVAAPYVIITLPRVQAPVRIRRNVYCLTAYSQEIRAYQRAIQVMRAKPATDPTSWQAQSNIHGAFRPNPAAGVVNACPPATPADLVAPPGMIASVCRHDQFFVAWHRMYLYYFERIVRAASGDPSFSLPYWGYSPAGQRDLPAMFRSPANISNQLWTDQRVPTINAGSNLNPSAVDATTALGNIPFNQFQSSLNSTPHGVVHTSVGGSCGWMSFFETAGMDPIFWLHHCNIDRLWDDWIASGGGRTNPTGNPSWMNQTFTFYDESAASVSLTVPQILETATQLSYRYAAPTACQTGPNYCLPLRPWLRDLQLIARLDTIATRPALPSPIQAIQRQAVDTLGAAAREIRLPITPEARNRFASLTRDPQAGRSVNLRFDDIRLTRRPAVYYEVYVNLREAADTAYTSPHYIGNLDFFGSARDSTGMFRELDLTAPAIRLQRMGRWPQDTLRVTLVPRSSTASVTPLRALGERPQATVGRVSVVFE